jgi:hypothetical protein
MPGGFLLAAIFCCLFLVFLAATVNTRFERRKWLLMTAVGDLAIHQEDEAFVEKLAECGIHGLSIAVAVSVSVSVSGAVSGYYDTSENDCWAVDTVLCDYGREEGSC